MKDTIAALRASLANKSSHHSETPAGNKSPLDHGAEPKSFLSRAMINVHEKLALLLMPLVLGVAPLDLRAETASTPAGFYRLACLGNSDTIISIPFSRPETAFARVQSIAGSVVTVSGTPGWSENQFVYAFGSQSNTYYLRVLAGAKEGSYYPIVANGTNSLTVSLGGDDISSVTNDTRLLVVPYWTLGSAFPGGRGIIPSASALVGSAAFGPDTAGTGGRVPGRLARCPPQAESTSRLRRAR